MLLRLSGFPSRKFGQKNYLHVFKTKVMVVEVTKERSLISPGISLVYSLDSVSLRAHVIWISFIIQVLQFCFYMIYKWYKNEFIISGLRLPCIFISRAIVIKSL